MIIYFWCMGIMLIILYIWWSIISIKDIVEWYIEDRAWRLEDYTVYWDSIYIYSRSYIFRKGDNMTERKIIHSVYFEYKETAEKFQQLYSEYFTKINGHRLGGLFHSGYSNIYPWICSFTCTASQWADMKKKLNLKRVVIYTFKFDGGKVGAWVFKEETRCEQR